MSNRVHPLSPETEAALQEFGSATADYGVALAVARITGIRDEKADARQVASATRIRLRLAELEAERDRLRATALTDAHCDFLLDQLPVPDAVPLTTHTRDYVDAYRVAYERLQRIATEALDEARIAARTEPQESVRAGVKQQAGQWRRHAQECDAMRAHSGGDNPWMSGAAYVYRYCADELEGKS